jgi:hypothetical protein
VRESQIIKGLLKMVLIFKLDYQKELRRTSSGIRKISKVSRKQKGIVILRMHKN